MKKKMGYFLFALLLPAFGTKAQSMNEATAAQLKMLLQFQGFWETNAATLQMDGKEQHFAYTADFKTTADNNGFTMIEKANIPGMGKLYGANLAGVSPNDGKIHWFSVDNLGTTHEHTGLFTDSRHFSMTHTGLQNGKEYLETISVTFDGKGLMHMKETATLDGKTLLVITGTFHRRKKN